MEYDSVFIDSSTIRVRENNNVWAITWQVFILIITALIWIVEWSIAFVGNTHIFGFWYAFVLLWLTMFTFVLLIWWIKK